jgi:acetolactate synthase-1/2/3 large subunit
MHVGGDPTPWVERADVILAIDALVPFELTERTFPFAGRVIGIGADPLFARTPMRGFPVDVALGGGSAATLELLHDRLLAAGGTASSADQAWRDEIAAARKAREMSCRETAAQGAGRPMSAAHVSRCLSEARGEDAVIFNELGVEAAMMAFTRPGSYFSAGFAGGLGWGLPAAQGFQLADRGREVIACIGDGSYIFANPVACHMVAMAEKLPLLTVLFNNGIWNAVKRATLGMYPTGEAAASNAMPLVHFGAPPDYAALARAHGLWGDTCDDGAELPAKLAEALRVIRDERRPALLEVVVA